MRNLICLLLMILAVGCGRKTVYIYQTGVFVGSPVTVSDPDTVNTDAAASGIPGF